MAVPRTLRQGARGGVGRGDTCGTARRRSARSRRRSRQGRLARRAGCLPARRRPRRLDAPGLAVGSVRAAARARSPRRPRADRRRLPPDRLPEGVHGRDARLPDRVAARRLRRRHHERGGARGDRSCGRGGRLARRRPRDRRCGEPRGARRVRGDARRMGAARSAPASRARAVPRAGGRRSLCRARCRVLGPVQPRALGSRPRGAVLAGSARRRVRIPVALGLRRARRERLGRSGRGARPAGRDSRRCPADDRRATRVASGGVHDGRAGAPARRPSTLPGSRATSGDAASSCPASSPTSSCSRAIRSTARPTSSSRSRSSRRWSADAGCTTRRPGTECGIDRPDRGPPLLRRDPADLRPGTAGSRGRGLRDAASSVVVLGPGTAVLEVGPGTGRRRDDCSSSAPIRWSPSSRTQRSPATSASASATELEVRETSARGRGARAAARSTSPRQRRRSTGSTRRRGSAGSSALFVPVAGSRSGGRSFGDEAPERTRS